MNQQPATLDELEYRVRMLEINMDDRIETVVTVQALQVLVDSINELHKEVFPNTGLIGLPGKIIHVGIRGPKKSFWESYDGQPKWWAKPFRYQKPKPPASILKKY